MIVEVCKEEIDHNCLQPKPSPHFSQNISRTCVSILPTSLTNFSPLTRVYSTWEPVAVYGTIAEYASFSLQVSRLNGPRPVDERRVLANIVAKLESVKKRRSTSSQRKRILESISFLLPSKSSIYHRKKTGASVDHQGVEAHFVYKK